MSIKTPLLAGALCALTLAGSNLAYAQDKPFEGVTVNLMTRPGEVIARRLAERGAEFEAMTGAKIVVNEVPFAELFQKIQTDWSTGTNSIDVGVLAAGWAVELDASGLIEDLTPYVAADPLINEADIAPYFREVNQKIGGATKLITVDGDFQMVYYRDDILTAAGLSAPDTWEEYLANAKAVHGQDMNGDGEADFGSCIFKKRNAQSYFAISTVAAGAVQSKGTAEGLFFDLTTMKPKINNAAWKAAFELYKATGEFGPPDELNQDIGDTRSLVKAGRCAQTIDWGDIGPLSIQDDATAIKDKMFAVMNPGWTSVLDPATGEMVACDATTCPNAINGVNHSPFGAFGGWAGVVNAKSDQKVKDAAYGFLSYMNQAAQSNLDVTIGWTGYNPYRNSQLDDTKLWVEAGFSEMAAVNYLGAIKNSLNNPNMSSDMRIPGAQQYTGVILDTELSRYLAGEITVEEALANIEAGWEEVTEDFGRDVQLELYTKSLGATNQ
jgi:multiple sugar transport system substrate-binding protein